MWLAQILWTVRGIHGKDIEAAIFSYACFIFNENEQLKCIP